MSDDWCSSKALVNTDEPVIPPCPKLEASFQILTKLSTKLRDREKLIACQDSGTISSPIYTNLQTNVHAW